MVPGGALGPGLGEQLGLEQLPRLAWRTAAASGLGPWRTAASRLGAAAASRVAPLIH
ncbi:hypothetical protein MSG_03467 [Mycobacterium shigaense]|uniref:Uncharacterized protein n=1 Tax=Mycobacterium shigaense TaxID=722731 RepID=A0A1Z4EL02_9MYCO|nr:hypothetical protein MSG_03467 [Mycobacterium shigaense]